jgi:hypothetical protein
MRVNGRLLLGSAFTLAVGFGTVAVAQAPEPPLDDTRLTVHTLLREDFFAGLLQGNEERVARSERNIQRLMEKRPNDKASLLAWQSATILYRAVQAWEKKRVDQFESLYKKSQDLMAQARQLPQTSGPVDAIRGGMFVFIADRLPKHRQAEAWAQAYESYQILWKAQAPVVEQLPLHLKGELLAGLTQSAERSGHKDEAAVYLDKMLTLLHDTPYESVAREWKANPESRTQRLACRSCHEAGRLEDRLAALGKK